MHHPARLVALLFLAVAGRAAAGDSPVQLQLSVTPNHIAVGETAHLQIDLLDAEGRPAAADRDLELRLEGIEDLLPLRPSLETRGRSQLSIQLNPERQGAWVISARGAGVYGASVAFAAVEVSVSPGEAAIETEAVPTGPPVGAEAQMAAQARPAASEIEPAFTDFTRTASARREDSPAVGSGGALESLERTSSAHFRRLTLRDPESRSLAFLGFAPEEGGVMFPALPSPGRILLKPAHMEVAPRIGGVREAKVFAFWQGSAAGSLAPVAIPFRLHVLAGRGTVEFEPTEAIIAADSASAEVRVRANWEGEARVSAVWAGPEPEPISIRFRSPNPVALSFVHAEFQAVGLAGAKVPVTVRLLGEDGAPTITDRELTVNTFLDDPSNPTEGSLTIPAGSGLGRASLSVTRLGRFPVTAHVGDLRSAEAVACVRLDLQLLFLAAGAGFFGAIVRLVLGKTRRKSGWLLRTARVLFLGVAAALVVWLVATLRLLSLLRAVLPFAEEIANSMPAGNQATVVLLGFLAGLLSDVVFAALLPQPVDEASNQPQPPPEGGLSPASPGEQPSPIAGS